MSASLVLFAWTSPSFPVGAFAYSHGLEWAVEAGDIRDAATLRDWLSDLLAFGAPRNDAILFGAAWQATTAADWPAVLECNELALAMAGSRERHLETSAQGNAFWTAVSAAWPPPNLDGFAKPLADDIAYPVAFAMAAAGHSIPLAEALAAFCFGSLANLVSAAVRLGAIGQTDGQRVTAALLREIAGLARFATTATLDDLGGAAFRSDLAALQHETQYSRLFRS